MDFSAVNNVLLACLVGVIALVGIIAVIVVMASKKSQNTYS